MNIRNWSFQKKITAFGISLFVGGTAIFLFYLGSMNFIFKVQDRYKNASEVHRLLSELKMDYSRMAIAILDYMNSGSSAAWERKLAADKAGQEHFNELRALSFNPDLAEYLELLGTFDEKKLDVLDNKARYLMENRAGMEFDRLKWFVTWYQPVYDEVQQTLFEAAMITENDQELAYDEQRALSEKAGIMMGIVIFLGTLVGVFLSRKMGRMIGDPLKLAIERLEKEASQTRQSVGSITGASQELAQSTTEQAAALQETAASVEEMSAMISKSADNASRSGKAASQSADVATKGKKASEEMLRSIHEINESNASIMHAIEESNQKITDITRVIAEIGNKTKVINDIVFQTKLLSFNASVEAARAGEHGKGFAVVAEEVGNLAQMSGNAAKEIAEMLDSSIERVEGIVSETKSKVERLISEGRAKVETGTKIAEENGKVLEDIVEQVGKVNIMINEIATSSNEQAQGVGEITKAMGQLDQVTQQNSSVSNQVASAAERLSAQAGSLGEVVKSLEVIVWGEKDSGSKPLALSPAKDVVKTAKPELPAAKAAPVADKVSVAPVADNVVPIRKSVAKQASGTAISEEGLPAENDPRFKEV